MASLHFIAAILTITLLVPPPPAAAITCGNVISYLSPCTSYLKTGGATPPNACCTGAGSLASVAKSAADRQTICACLKTASKAINPNPSVAKSLPTKCGINLPFELSPTVDCSKIA